MGPENALLELQRWWFENVACMGEGTRDESPLVSENTHVSRLSSPMAYTMQEVEIREDRHILGDLVAHGFRLVVVCRNARGLTVSE